MKIHVGNGIVDMLVSLSRIWFCLLLIIVGVKSILMEAGSNENKAQNMINSGNMILLTADSGANIRGTEYVDTETGVHYIVWFDSELRTSAISVRYGSTGEVIKEVANSD